ncbi:hypothetical protein QQF64_022311 [Cirrhinus molitorella]|uniref:Uncharacterized protein n=1 Tax=Cirrhinus molitorella TaxID=172907 RepID=A0ABR3L803_9TELE
MLFADSDSEGEYLPFGNDDRPSNYRASPGMGLAGVKVFVVSIEELFLEVEAAGVPADVGRKGEGATLHRRAGIRPTGVRRSGLDNQL